MQLERTSRTDVSSASSKRLPTFIRHSILALMTLCSIVIAPGTGIACVSSQKSLYELRYACGK